MSKTIRLVILEENELLRLGLSAAVDAEGDIDVVADLAPGDEALAVLERLAPHVALLSVNGDSDDGLSACQTIREQMPSIKVVLMSVSESEEEMVEAMILGASGYVSRGASRADIVRTVRVVASGGAWFDREVADRVLGRLREAVGGGLERPPELLSEREKAILAMLAEGSSNKKIGERLNVATSTVSNNMTAIRSKLGLYSRSELKEYASKYGLADVSGEETRMGDAAD